MLWIKCVELVGLIACDSGMMMGIYTFSKRALTMNLFDMSAILVTAAALGSFVNYKWIKLSPAIGLLLLAMCFGLLGIGLQKFGLIGNSIDVF